MLEVMLATPAPLEDGRPYAIDGMGSWFGVADLEVRIVPRSIHDADEVEEILNRPPHDVLPRERRLSYEQWSTRYAPENEFHLAARQLQWLPLRNIRGRSHLRRTLSGNTRMDAHRCGRDARDCPVRTHHQSHRLFCHAAGIRPDERASRRLRQPRPCRRTHRLSPLLRLHRNRDSRRSKIYAPLPQEHHHRDQPPDGHDRIYADTGARARVFPNGDQGEPATFDVSIDDLAWLPQLEKSAAEWCLKLIEEPLERLTAEYSDWLVQNDLQQLSADELILENLERPSRSVSPISSTAGKKPSAPIPKPIRDTRNDHDHGHQRFERDDRDLNEPQ